MGRKGAYALYNVTAGREGTAQSRWCGSATVTGGHEVIEFLPRGRIM